MIFCCRDGRVSLSAPNGHDMFARPMWWDDKSGDLSARMYTLLFPRVAEIVDDSVGDDLGDETSINLSRGAAPVPWMADGPRGLGSLAADAIRCGYFAALCATLIQSRQDGKSQSSGFAAVSSILAVASMSLLPMTAAGAVSNATDPSAKSRGDAPAKDATASTTTTSDPGEGVVAGNAAHDRASPSSGEPPHADEGLSAIEAVQMLSKGTLDTRPSTPTATTPNSTIATNRVSDRRALQATTPITTSNIKAAADECRAESADYNCPISQQTYGPIEDWDVSQVEAMRQRPSQRVACPCCDCSFDRCHSDMIMCLCECVRSIQWRSKLGH